MKKTTGFTLIELMVALAVFAIMAAIAVPNLQGLLQRNGISNQTNMLVANLNLARSEAVKRNARIALCWANADQDACLTSTDPTPWEDGWLVFIDSDEDEELDAGETILRVNDPVGSGNTIRSGQYKNTLFYNGDGSISAAGTFRICDKAGNEKFAKAINIQSSGIISLAKDTDATPDDISNDFQNNNIACP
ncbi:MAG: GspH/FimT family pseudopilin [Thioalkalispiraceae bacterium]|jgi:type IV fimbrial biogenesis protein FimT